MDVFCTEEQSVILTLHGDAAERVLPLPCVVDSRAVVLINLLVQEQRQRPVVLDASGVQRLHPVAALLLAATLRRRSEDGAPVQIASVPHALRRQIGRHPLAAFVRRDDDRSHPAAV